MSNLSKSPKRYEWSEEERLAIEKFKKEKSEGKHKNSMYIPHYPNPVIPLNDITEENKLNKE